MVKTPVSTPLSKSCKYCGSTIPKFAIFCKECDNFLSPWRNEIRYWSGTVGIITLIVSGLTFTVAYGKQLYRDYFGLNLVVTDFSTTDKMGIWNTSSGGILITSISFKSAAPYYTMVWPSSVVVKENEVVEVKLLERAKLEWAGTLHDIVSKDFGDYAFDLNEKEQQDLLANKEAVVRSLVPDFLFTEGAEYKQQVEMFGKSMFTFPCDGAIEYLEIGDGSKRDMTVPCVGTVRRLK